MRKLTLIIVLVLTLFIVSACGECKKDSDCENKKCFTVSCKDKTCDYIPVPECCGNGIKENTEDGAVGNECTCPQDYGFCQGSSGQYLTKLCNDEKTECALDFKKGAQKMSSTTYRRAYSGNNFKVTAYYNTPFNLDADTFRVDIGLESIQDKASDIKITKLTLNGKNSKSKDIILGEKEVNKYILDTETSISDEIILDFTTTEQEEKISYLSILINFEYLYDSGRTKLEKTESFKFDLTKAELIYANPTSQRACPDSCDDDNAGTADSCSASTDFFCSHKPIPNACGNFKCDSYEDKCTCPQDCGKCDGTVGEYLESTCYQNKCITQIRNQVSITPETIFEERNLGKFKLNIYYTYNKPFNIKEDSFKVDMDLLSVTEGSSSPKVTKVVFLESSTLLADKEVSLLFSGLGDSKSVSMPVTFSMVDEYDEKITSVKVYYEYKEQVGDEVKDRQGSFIKTLGNIYFINPG